MGDGGRADELDAPVASRTAVEPVEERFAASEEDGHDGQVQLVDQLGAQLLRWAMVASGTRRAAAISRVMRRRLL